MQGKFIVIEGGEGTGKTTLARNLKARLDPEQFIFTREPGGTPFAEEMRKIIFAQNDDPFKELCLFFAARRDHVLKLVRPALEAGKHVISDRYVASTYAYQIAAPKHAYLEDCLSTMVRFAEAPADPYGDNVLAVHYLWLDGSVEVCLKRRLADKKSAMNSFDGRPIEFHEGVRKGFSRFFEDNRGSMFHFAAPQCVRINAEHSEEQVCEAALEAVLEMTEMTKCDRRRTAA